MSNILPLKLQILFWFCIMDWSIPHVLTKVNVMLLHIGKRHLSYGEKVDLINIFEAEKNFRFIKKKKKSVKHERLLFFP